MTEHTPESRTDDRLICGQWMTAKVHTVKPLDSVAHARALIEEHRINQLPVVKDGRLMGIVTDRDLRDAVNAVTVSANMAGTMEPVPGTPEQTPVEAVMTHNAMTLSPHSSGGRVAYSWSDDGTLLAHWDYEMQKGASRRRAG